MSVSGVAITRLRKSSREALQIKHIFLFKQNENRIRLYLRPYRRFGMPVVWRIWTRNFPSTSLCVAAYSTASQHTRLSLQVELSLSVYILQMVPRPAFRLLCQLKTRDIHASRASDPDKVDSVLAWNEPDLLRVFICSLCYLADDIPNYEFS